MWDSEARFETLMDTAPMIIWMSDAAGLHTFFNKLCWILRAAG
jgi:PAS domain-containing protein